MRVQSRNDSDLRTWQTAKPGSRGPAFSTLAGQVALLQSGARGLTQPFQRLETTLAALPVCSQAGWLPAHLASHREGRLVFLVTVAPWRAASPFYRRGGRL